MPRRFFILIIVIVAVAGLGAWLRHRQTQIRRVTSLLEQAVRYEARSDWPKLETVSSDWLAIDPVNSEASFFAGKSIARRANLTPQRADEAFQLLSCVTSTSTRHQESLELQLGLLFGTLNRAVEARELAIRVLNQYPDSEAARMMYCNYLLMTLDRLQLLNQIYEAMETESDVPVHFGYLAIVDSAFLNDRTSTLRKWRTGAPQDESLLRAEDLSRLLDARIKLVANVTDVTQETAEQAVRRVEPWLQADPVSSAVVRELLQVRIESADLTGVSELLQISDPDADKDPFCRRARGWYRTTVEEYGLAESELLKARELFPFSWKTHNELAVLYRRMGQAENALKMQAIADRGRELDTRVRSLGNIRDIDPEFLISLHDYARLCGDERCAAALQRRLAGTDFSQK